MSDTNVTNAERYLCFSVGSEQFACPLMLVKEVVALTDLTPVPQAPAYFLGIMNLRGQVISVIDLKKKFGIKPQGPPDQATIIFDIDGISIGVSVDSVDSVANVTSLDMTSKPELVFPMSSDFLSGVFRREKQLVLVIDLVKIFSKDEKLMLSNQRAKNVA